MRLTCPLCGERDRREFTYYGASAYADRPPEGAGADAWDDYLHLRDNPAGVTQDLWYHELGCSAWIVVARNTVTHEVLRTGLLTDRQRFVGKFVYQEGDLREIPAPSVPPARKPRKAAAPAPRNPRKGKGAPE